MQNSWEMINIKALTHSLLCSVCDTGDKANLDPRLHPPKSWDYRYELPHLPKENVFNAKLTLILNVLLTLKCKNRF